MMDLRSELLSLPFQMIQSHVYGSNENTLLWFEDQGRTVGY